MKRIRRIIIEQSLNGYKVAVGCETVLFAGPNAADELHSTLARYLQDPRGVEAEYLKKYAPEIKLGSSEEEGLDRPTGGGVWLKPWCARLWRRILACRWRATKIRRVKQ